MNKFSKYLIKKQKSILSLLLACILMLTFNYAPISILIENYKQSNAYKANTTQSYYPNSSTTNESNISTGSYPSSLEKYFEGSNRNFNIATYYSNRFYDIYSNNLHSYLNDSRLDEIVAGFTTLYKNYLDFLGFETLYDYYNSNSSELNDKYEISDFRGYAEYFVTHQTTWTDSDGDEHTISALFTLDGNQDDPANETDRIKFYNSFANFVKKENISVDGDDGITNETEDFYKDSVSYNRLKSYIDTYIEQTIAIYTYDGTTQNKNVAGILANGVPTSQSYYYSDGEYKTIGEPIEKYMTVSGSDKKVIYYFGSEQDIQNYDVYINNKDAFSINNISVLEKEPILYRLIKSGETGYIDDSHPTYYKYDSSTPYTTTNSAVDIYILNDSPTDNELATYNSLYYNVITSEELLEDADFYVQIPYSESNTIYFENITGYSKTELKFENFVNAFTTNKTGATESIIYFKLRENTDRVVYFDTSTGLSFSEFQNTHQDFMKSHVVVEINLNNVDNSNDYYKIDPANDNYHSYYVDGYPLYFEKVKVNYETVDTSESVYTGEYEMVATANIPYEKTNVPSESYEMNSGKKVIYVLSENQTEVINGVTYKTVSASNLAAIKNEYVAVPDFVSDELNDTTGTYKFYYRHTLIEVNQIYVIDNDEDASNNEVYQNLHYNVITSDEYDANFYKYSVISSEDENYNKDFKLYYKYDETIERENLYVQNEVRGDNAIYIIDDSLTSADRTRYKLNNFTPITTSDFNAESEFYVQILENDDNYSTEYTKLYYKYSSNATLEKAVYIYSSKSSTEYLTFYNTDSDYVASDYELIQPGEPNYVEGTELYYKRIRNEKYVQNTQETYFYYQTTSTVSLKANSYYAISFYVYTNGYYDEAKEFPVEASVYMRDTNNVLSEIKLEEISTDGKWQKYYFFIATNTISTSAINLYFYMGNSESILGSTYNADDPNSNFETVTGTVLFDDIKVMQINETDYTKRAINDVPVLSTQIEEDDSADTGTEEPSTQTDTTTPSDKDVDEYGNLVFVANEMTKYNSIIFDNKTKNDVKLWNNLSWNEMFNVDGLSDTFAGLTFEKDENDKYPDGYSDLNDIWQYYIGREVSGQGNNDRLKQYQNAYSSGDLILSVIDESTIVKNLDDKVDEDEDESSSKASNSDSGTSSGDDDKDDDIKVVESTFRKDNKVLKVENKNRLVTLGITSNTIEVEQMMYYKITVWVYATDKDAKATVLVNSIMKTATSPELGTQLQTEATIDACFDSDSYSKDSTNEYGWIPITIYIEGNSLHNQDITLVLSAGRNSTVYYDNISIERITSAAYDTASSDKDDTTFTLSLNPSSANISNGITNGYFNNVTITNNYNDIDYTLPRTAETWTVESINSTNVIAGVVPTGETYTSRTENFYTKYNNGEVPTSNDGLPVNVYAIYAPSKVKASISNATDKEFDTTNIYKIYTGSMSLSASNVYKISFDFYAGYEFDGTMTAAIYQGSVATDKVVSTITASEFNEGWNTYTFYIATGTASSTVYLEIGVENATGTCFFKSASNTTEKKSLDEIRDDMITSDENSSSNADDIYNKDTFKNIRFINLADSNFTIHGDLKDDVSNYYENNEYNSTLDNTSSYTVGKSGIVVSSYYTYVSEYSYTVTINEVEYYIKGVTDEETGKTVYKLYSDSIYTDEVKTIDGKEVSIPSLDKVVIGTETNNTEYDITETEERIYSYNFTENVTINNIEIQASEFNNNYSQNVMVLANGLSTDYTVVSPRFSNSLKTNSYYVLRIYVKTSDFDNEDFGLTMKIGTISVTWENINTVGNENADENGFVCYQALITTNTSSISNLNIEFSLGSKDSTGSGYAIIAGAKLEQYSTEKLFNEYVSTLDENDETVKKFFGTKSNDSDDDDDDDDSGINAWAATFFYVFSSLLLGVVLVVAIVAVVLKKHPIKHTQEFENEHEQSNDPNSPKTSKKNSFIDVNKEEPKTTKQNDINNNDDEGFV